MCKAPQTLADGFNPRPREEGDLLDVDAAPRLRRVSIHALAKRATRSIRSKLHRGIVSIHALAKRATSPSLTGGEHANSFNPRPREEGDGNGTHHDHLVHGFNPRPREEGDTKVAPTLPPSLTFQSTPSRRGRRLDDVRRRPEFDVSIHALAKRATPPP